MPVSIYSMLGATCCLIFVSFPPRGHLYKCCYQKQKIPSIHAKERGGFLRMGKATTVVNV